MKEADRDVAAIAAGQYGVFSRRQAAKAGLKDEAMTRRVMAGRWERLLPGVYRLAGVPPTRHQRAIAAVLWAGPKSAISFTSAEWLLKLAPARGGPWHVTRPSSSTKVDRAVVVHRSALSRADVVEVDGIRCTSATRTILDCAGILGDEPLEAAFEQARRLGLTSPTALAQRAEQLCGKGHPGSARVRRLLAAQAPGERALESRLEVRLARLLRTSGLPAPARQYPVGRYRLDFAWPAVLIACECDGFEHHGARLAWKRDRARLARIEAAGWRVVHVTWDDVTRRPEQTRERLAVALRPAA
jgi:very-short-patch-repair endonuclease